MPKALEQKLAKIATKMNLKGKRRNAYIYGNKAMQKYLREKRIHAKV